MRQPCYQIKKQQLISNPLLHMAHTRYENDWFYYVWKPHNIATTFGDQPSFVEELIKTKWNQIKALQENRSLAGEQYFHTIQELGLVNRLDNQTAGLLFFAKNQIIFDTYKVNLISKNLNQLDYCLTYNEKKSLLVPLFTITKASLRRWQCKKNIKEVKRMK